MKTDKYVDEIMQIVNRYFAPDWEATTTKMELQGKYEIQQQIKNALLDTLKDLRNHIQPAKFYKPGQSYNAEGVEWKYIQDKINKLEQEELWQQVTQGK